MKEEEFKREVDKIFSTPHLMTPDALWVGTKGRVAWEISEGQGIIPGQRFWGLTILREKDGEVCSDLDASRPFPEMPALLRHLADILEE